MAVSGDPSGSPLACRAECEERSAEEAAEEEDIADDDDTTTVLGCCWLGSAGPCKARKAARLSGDGRSTRMTVLFEVGGGAGTAGAGAGAGVRI